MNDAVEVPKSENNILNPGPSGEDPDYGRATLRCRIAVSRANGASEAVECRGLVTSANSRPGHSFSYAHGASKRNRDVEASIPMGLNNGAPSSPPHPRKPRRRVVRRHRFGGRADGARRRYGTGCRARRSCSISSNGKTCSGCSSREEALAHFERRVRELREPDKALTTFSRLRRYRDSRAADLILGVWTKSPPPIAGLIRVRIGFCGSSATVLKAPRQTIDLLTARSAPASAANRNFRSAD